MTKNIQFVQPALWLIILIVGLPQLSETVYTPALPDIAHSLHTSEAMVEYTLSIYLVGFAIGTFFWGNLSDRRGRRLCVLWGLAIYSVGCIGCFLSESVVFLMLSRFVQAFGGSIGRVLGQAICRDIYRGIELKKVYALISGALAIYPALGPIVGGVLTQSYHWNTIFIFLFIIACIVIGLSWYKLPETHTPDTHKRKSILRVLKQLLSDRQVIECGLIVGVCNGIFFSYVGEGSFILIEYLKFTPSQYGMSFFPLAGATIIGGLVSRYLVSRFSAHGIIMAGIISIVVGNFLTLSVMLVNDMWLSLGANCLVSIVVGNQMISLFGVCLCTSNALAMALVRYTDTIGVASSIFGFFYYSIIALSTYIMGVLHNGGLVAQCLLISVLWVCFYLVFTCFHLF